MSASQEEIKKREKTAIAAIKNAFDTEGDEYGGTLFVHHHLEEIEEDFWIKHLGTSHPEPKQVLDILVLQSHWDSEDDEGIDVFDFTLPDDITNYVICVRFDEEGQIEEITVES